MRSKIRLHSESTTTFHAGPRALATATLALVVLSAACAGEPNNTAAGGVSSMIPTAGAGPDGKGGSTTGAGGAAGGDVVPTAGAANASSGAGGTLASAGTSGVLGLAGTGIGIGVGGMPGIVSPPPTNSDHCLKGYDPEASDATMMAGPAKFKTSAGDDTILQPEVLQWMSDHKWTGGHVFWHAFRGCKDGTAQGLVGPLGYSNKLCSDYPVLVPADQNCRTAGDGYEFLLFHRHMLQALKQLWPKHAADFAGFPTFPKTKAEVPDVFNAPNWSATVLAAADIADNISKPENLAKFPNEGVLGHWLQCNVGAAKLPEAKDEPYIGLHFNLHDQWSRGAASEHGLNNGQVNITNYMFWKLHGWIDNVWEKYRVAKGLTTDPAAMQKYRQDLTSSCNQMDYYEKILKAGPGSPPTVDCAPDVKESGDFHTKVRPLFESESNHCASCHGPTQTSPYADLTLGGQVSSRCIVQRLKSKGSRDGGQIPLIQAGDPEHSFLYLKPAGLADAAGCVSTNPDRPCNTATMPPSGKTMTDAELKILYDWIKAGAAGPP